MVLPTAPQKLRALPVRRLSSFLLPANRANTTAINATKALILLRVIGCCTWILTNELPPNWRKRFQTPFETRRRTVANFADSTFFFIARCAAGAGRNGTWSPCRAARRFVSVEKYTN